MQFIARLHTPRTAANRLQVIKLYASNLESAEYLAKSLLAPEPLGAWAEIARITDWQSGAEVPVKSYIKELNADGKEIIRTVVLPDPRLRGIGEEPGGKADAGKEQTK